MRLRYLLPLIYSICLLAFAGCDGSEVDTEAPTLEVIEYVPAPKDGFICGTIQPDVFHLTGGDQLSLDLLFKDNSNLSQYKIDIHNNFDCHGHGGGSAPTVNIPDVENQTTDWAVLDIKSLSGTTVPVSVTLDVPSNITSGNYHFQIQVLDESGNDDPLANIYSLLIKHPSDDIAPAILKELPDQSSLTIKKGEQLRFKGSVSDNHSLSEGGNGLLYLAYTDLDSGNTFTTDVVIPFDSNVDKSYDFDFEYTIARTLVAKTYRFFLGAHDGVRNVADVVSFDVTVEN